MPPVFFLGGYDLEMVTIRDLLAAESAAFHDKHLAWGAKASAYRQEIAEALARGETPVLVELENDLGLSARLATSGFPVEGEHLKQNVQLPRLIAQRSTLNTQLSTFNSPPSTPHPPPSSLLVVDHHGPLAGAERPTSLHQVFHLLGFPPERWTRHLDLVAANDRGHIRGMLQLQPPATRPELLTIRAADRAAQGVTPEDEAAARDAVAARELLAGGRLTLLRLASTKTSPAADMMEPALGGPGFENLLIVSPGEVNFFGEGRFVRGLDQAFPGGWSGGALPDRGFWGGRSTDPQAVVTWLVENPLIHARPR